MKRLFAFLAAICLLLTVTPAVSAEETVPTEEAPGIISSEPAYIEAPRAESACGEELTWEFEDGTLTITGSGPMDDFTEGAPWAAHMDDIKVVILSGEVTTVGAFAFIDCDNLIAVDFGSALQEIDTAAFKNCDGLTTISLPDTFRRFGEESFMGCSNLKEIHCDGGFPSFNLNCLWNTWTKIYFPEERPWSVVYIQQLEEAFKGRIEFLASDGSDPYVPTEPEETEEAAEPEETVPETTVPPTTEAPTEAPTTEPAVTEAVTEPPVTQQTQPSVETEAPETEPPVTEETREETAPEALEDTARGGFGGLAVISGVMCVLILGALVFRRRKF